MTDTIDPLAVAMRLRALAEEMRRVAYLISDHNGDAECLVHGAELINSAEITDQWAERWVEMGRRG